MEDQSNEALWYVVHTYSGYENKVATDLAKMVENRRLQDLICEPGCPTPSSWCPATGPRGAPPPT